MKSQYFSDATRMAAEFTTLSAANRQRAERLDLVRKFSNGLSAMTEAEAEELGVDEITNYLTLYSRLSARANALMRTYTATNRFCDVRVKTGNPEVDHDWSDAITSIINEGIFYHRGYMRRFLKGLAGEIQIAGGAPIIPVPEDGGWLPSIGTNVLFPGRTKTDTLELQYFFIPKDCSHDYLSKLLSNKYGVRENASRILDYIKSVPEEGKKTEKSFAPAHSQEEVGSVVDDNPRIVTVKAFWYCEVVRVGSRRHVNGWLISEEIPEANGQDKIEPMILAKKEKFYDSLDKALQLVDMDREIGGDTTWDSVRGVAEIVYPSASKMEELLNAIISGDTERARLRFQPGSESVADDILAWDHKNDMIVPKGVEPFDLKNSSAALQAPLGMLGGVVSQITGGPQANPDEKVVQAKQRVGLTSQVEMGGIFDWYEHLDQLLETVAERVLAGKVKEDSQGYDEIQWVRQKLREKGINPEKLAEREHGRMKYITVRVNRIIGDGDWQSSQDVAKFLLDVTPSLPPQSRSRIMKMAITAVCGDPDLADELVTVPKAIINAQKLTAENECDTIMRRAVLGQVIPTSAEDIHQDHIPVHMVDMTALVARNQSQPWTKLDVIRFAALQRHTQDHLELLLGDKKTQDEGRSYVEEFTKIVQAAAAVAQVVEDSNPEGSGLSPKEEADIQIKLMAEQRKSMELGVKIEEMHSLQKNRMERDQLARRNGFVSEITTAAKLSLEKQRAAREASKPDKTK